ncbi:MAG: hypothetical protein ACREIV_11690, partial [Planctomycetaceae bacterium]
PDEILREVRRGDEVTARERFALPAGENRFDLSEDGDRVTLIHVRRASQMKNTPGRTHEFRITAVRGRDRRYLEDDQ